MDKLTISIDNGLKKRLKKHCIDVEEDVSGWVSSRIEDALNIEQNVEDN